MEQEYKFMVCTSCMTYNHAPYIVDAMNGFTMQETTFPVYYLITDDASTDGEPDVIKQYLADFFQTPYRTEETDDYHLICATHKTNPNCNFIVFLLKYNHYSIKKSKLPYQAEWRDNAKYIALCEGDDYWIDPMKLQKQAIFLDAHPDYTMVCNRIRTYSEKKKRHVREQYCYRRSQDIVFKDIVNRTGLFIPTCSIVYRSDVTDNYPDYCKKCCVGDYPLQIMCGIKGKTYYIDDLMSIYRIDNSTSWMGNQKLGSASEARLKVLRSIVDVFQGFAKDYPQYNSIFQNKIANYINRGIPKRLIHSKAEQKRYFSFFEEEIRRYNIFWKIDLIIRSSYLFIDGRPYEKLFFGNHCVKHIRL